MKTINCYFSHETKSYIKECLKKDHSLITSIAFIHEGNDNEHSIKLLAGFLSNNSFKLRREDSEVLESKHGWHWTLFFIKKQTMEKRSICISKDGIEFIIQEWLVEILQNKIIHQEQTKVVFYDLIKKNET